MTTLISRRDTDSAVQVVLNRPEAGNALTTGMLDDLAEVLSALTHDAPANLVVIRGEGRHFCTGADIKEFAGDPDNPDRARRVALVAQCMDLLQRIPVPTVARVTGSAIGAGWGLALACDLLYATEAAAFRMPELMKGFMLPAAIAGRLAAVAGQQTAVEIVASGRTYPAGQRPAERWVTRTAATDDELDDVLRDLAAALHGTRAAALEDVLHDIRPSLRQQRAVGDELRRKN